jgi:1,4-alpha-glucan branching enzyme
LFRQLHYDQSAIQSITPGEYLDRHPTNQVATPSASSWGLKGYNEQWLNETNAWTYRHIHAAGERMVELARRHPSEADGVTTRALNQAARELMLAQASDWTFIMATGTTVPYATRRFNEHIVRFNRLYDVLSTGAEVDTSYLGALEAQDNIFPNVDYRIYAS